nr:hypothetical protein [Maliibacterium massiliense]
MYTTIRPLRAQEYPLLWLMLYLAIYQGDAQSPSASSTLAQPRLARYVQGIGRAWARRRCAPWPSGCVRMGLHRYP